MVFEGDNNLKWDGSANRDDQDLETSVGTYFMYYISMKLITTPQRLGVFKLLTNTASNKASPLQQNEFS